MPVEKPYALILLISAFVLPFPVAAQVSVEAHAGSSWPSGDLTATPGLNQKFGTALGVEANLALTDRLSVYLGGSRHGFRCNGCDTDVTSTGAQSGVKLFFDTGPVARPWIRAGVMLHQASVDGGPDESGVGLDAGIGLDWFLAETVSLGPSARLGVYDAGDVGLTFVTVGLGLQFYPGGR